MQGFYIGSNIVKDNLVSSPVPNPKLWMFTVVGMCTIVLPVLLLLLHMPSITHLSPKIIEL